jgi:NADPH:quinone reductase-like Zn-dependent oxidoreductase
VPVPGRVNRLMTSLELSNQRSWQTWSALSLLAAGFALGAYSGRKREKLEGRIAWVNGGSRGLGLLVAVEMARRGAKVAVTARDQAELDESRRLLGEFSPDHLAVRCDAAKRDQVEAAARQITQRFSRIDVLVNCASIIQVGPLQAMAAADFEEATRQPDGVGKRASACRRSR